MCIVLEDEFLLCPPAQWALMVDLVGFNSAVVSASAGEGLGIWDLTVVVSLAAMFCTGTNHKNQSRVSCCDSPALFYYARENLLPSPKNVVQG